MKKISKLTFAALLTLGLGFTACGGTDGPSYDPVERIAINSLTGYAVVGDVIDLDEYIKVFGGAGPTDFTVTVKENSKDIVSVEGHKVAILKEGEFQLDIKAGEQSGVFTGNAIAKLKNELDKLFRQVKKAGKWALAFSDVDDEGNVVLTGEKCVHAKNYFVSDHELDDETFEYSCGGLLVAGDGKTYGFEADDADGTNINVFPGALSDFSLYFCNMGLAVDASKFVIETEELEDGTTYEYLSLSTDYPSTKYSNYFSSKVDEIACSFFGNGMSDFEEMGAVINDLEVYPYENEDGSYDFEFYFSFDFNEDTYVFESAFLTTDPEIAQSAGVEAYIASGEVPPALDYSEYKAKFDAIAESKNYAYSAEIGWFNTSTLEKLDYRKYFDESFHPSWQTTVVDGTETGVVGEDFTYGKLTYNLHYRRDEDAEDEEHEYVPYETPVEQNFVTGLIINENKAYQYFENEEGTGYDASEIEGATNLWDDLSHYTAGALVAGEDFVVSSRDELEDGSIAFEVDTEIVMAGLGEAILNQTIGGRLMLNNYLAVVAQRESMEISELMEYSTVIAVVGEETTQLAWLFNWEKGVGLGTVITFSNVGGDNQFPIDTSLIDFSGEEEIVDDPQE